MKTISSTFICILALAIVFCIPNNSHGQVDPVWQENWNEAQKGRPATMGSTGRMTSDEEPGIPFVIHGQVLNPDGAEAAGVVINAYQRDHDGFEYGPNDDSFTTWRLQGWVETDREGRFELQTIRPAPDHLGREAAHIHFTLDSGEFGRQWATKIFLSDDPMVSTLQRRDSDAAGEFGAVREVRIADGIQHIDVRFKLKEKPDF